MRKFKLVKEYPNSPKLGTIIVSSTVSRYENNYKPTVYKTYTIDAKSEQCDNGNYQIPNPEDYKKFWQEIIEVKKDYEILSFIHNYNSHTIHLNINDKMYNENGSNTKYSLEYLLQCSEYKIYSIKRLIDNEIFTIGDKIISNFNFTHKIESFEIKDNLLKIGYYFPDKYYYNLNEINKSLKPLLTTEDDVDIFEGDSIYGVDDKFQLLYTTFATKEDIKVRSFSTKEAAEDYILMNKQCLSINDVLNKTAFPGNWDKILKELVKSKL